MSSYRLWAQWLDSRFRVPGTNIRFGLDPILSLIPGLGDLVSPAFAVLLIMEGLRQRVPKVILMRMVINALIDALIGAVPIAGSVGDIFWRANSANLALLEHHARPGRPPTKGDYFFVAGILTVMAACIVVPIALALWFMSKLLALFGTQ